MMPAMAGKRKTPLNKLGPWAKKCRAFRKALGNITQTEAAQKVGVPFGTWVAWENSRNVPTPFVQNAIKNAYPDHF